MRKNPEAQTRVDPLRVLPIEPDIMSRMTLRLEHDRGTEWLVIRNAMGYSMGSGFRNVARLRFVNCRLNGISLDLLAGSTHFVDCDMRGMTIRGQSRYFAAERCFMQYADLSRLQTWNVRLLHCVVNELNLADSSKRMRAPENIRLHQDGAPKGLIAIYHNDLYEAMYGFPEGDSRRPTWYMDAPDELAVRPRREEIVPMLNLKYPRGVLRPDADGVVRVSARVALLTADLRDFLINPPNEAKVRALYRLVRILWAGDSELRYEYGNLKGVDFQYLMGSIPPRYESPFTTLRQAVAKRMHQALRRQREAQEAAAGD